VWGVNTYGGLADGAVLPSASTPIQVGSLTTWRKVSCGNYYFLALKTNGTLWGWGGENYSGELGIGAGGTGGIHVNTPVQVGTVTTWTDVSAGDYHSLGVRSDGTLWAWGEGSLGQLGSGNVSVSTPIKIGTLTTWSKVATGSSVSYAIKTDKTLWSWGDNTKGPLGAGILGLRSSPVQVGSLNNWISVSAYYVALGIKG
jgi:alpha-tubulin suppressor-like RCC1 family protein